MNLKKRIEALEKRIRPAVKLINLEAVRQKLIDVIKDIRDRRHKVSETPAALSAVKMRLLERFNRVADQRAASCRKDL